MIWSRTGRVCRRYSWEVVLGHLIHHPYALWRLPCLLKSVAYTLYLPSRTFSFSCPRQGIHTGRMLEVLEIQMAYHFPSPVQWSMFLLLNNRHPSQIPFTQTKSLVKEFEVQLQSAIRLSHLCCRGREEHRCLIQYIKNIKLNVIKNSLLQYIRRSTQINTFSETKYTSVTSTWIKNQNVISPKKLPLLAFSRNSTKGNHPPNFSHHRAVCLPLNVYKCSTLYMYTLSFTSFTQYPVWEIPPRGCSSVILMAV